MHLNKILEQIKRHQSPTEAIDKLATALEKHEGSLLEKGFTILKSESENATRFNILGAKIDAQTQIINDKFCQLEMREMQNKIDTLRDEKNALQSSALLQQQTSNIVSQIRPCPVPAYLTCNPYGCNGGLNGYGYGYPYGYGDSCCA